MRSLWVILPALGLALSLAVPLARHLARERDEERATRLVREVLALQDTFRAGSGGYAPDMASLGAACAPGHQQATALLQQFDAVGYRVQVREASGAEALGAGCDGRALVSAYVVTAEPARPGGRRAATALSDGRVFVLYDGVAPTEGDIARGVPIPLERVDTFRIP